MCLCVRVRTSVCGFLYEVMAGGSLRDAALTRGSFKGPISVYSPADQSIQSFAEIRPSFSPRLLAPGSDTRCCLQLAAHSTLMTGNRCAS